MTEQACGARRCPCDAPIKPLGRIVRLARIGGYTAIRNKQLVAVGQRLLWDDVEMMRSQANRETNCLSDMVFDTGL